MGVLLVPLPLPRVMVVVAAVGFAGSGLAPAAAPVIAAVVAAWRARGRLRVRRALLGRAVLLTSAWWGGWSSGVAIGELDSVVVSVES